MAGFLPQILFTGKNNIGKTTQIIPTTINLSGNLFPKDISIFKNNLEISKFNGVELPLQPKIFSDIPKKKDEKIESEQLIQKDSELLESNELIKTFFDRISPALQYLTHKKNKTLNNPSLFSRELISQKISELAILLKENFEGYNLEDFEFENFQEGSINIYLPKDDEMVEAGQIQKIKHGQYTILLNDLDSQNAKLSENNYLYSLIEFPAEKVAVLGTDDKISKKPGIYKVTVHINPETDLPISSKELFISKDKKCMYEAETKYDERGEAINANTKTTIGKYTENKEIIYPENKEILKQHVPNRYHSTEIAQNHTDENEEVVTSEKVVFDASDFKTHVETKSSDNKKGIINVTQIIYSKDGSHFEVNSTITNKDNHHKKIIEQQTKFRHLTKINDEEKLISRSDNEKNRNNCFVVTDDGELIYKVLQSDYKRREHKFVKTKDGYIRRYTKNRIVQENDNFSTNAKVINGVWNIFSKDKTGKILLEQNSSQNSEEKRIDKCHTDNVKREIINDDNSAVINLEIKNSNGDIIANTHIKRTLRENGSVTEKTINGITTIYDTLVKDGKITVTKTDSSGGKNTIEEDMADYLILNHPKKEYVVELCDFLKHTDGEALYMLINNKTAMSYANEFSYNVIGNSLNIEDYDEYSFLHEIGHMNSQIKGIGNNPALISIYEQELQNIDKNDQFFIQYFTKTSLAGISGIDELVAEVFAIANSNILQSVDLDIRAAKLQQYFPNTIAKIIELSATKN